MQQKTYIIAGMAGVAFYLVYRRSGVEHLSDKNRV